MYIFIGDILRVLIGARLKEERERLGYNQIEFAAIGGASNRSQIDWEKGKQVPNAEFLALVALSGADVQYVLTGKSSTTALAEDENELLNGYRRLDLRDKANMLGLLQIMGLTSQSKPAKIISPEVDKTDA